MTTLITKDNLAANTITAEKISSAVALGGPKISSLDYPGDDTAADPAGGQSITVNGTGFVTGAVIHVDGTVVSPVTFNSANSLTFTAPAKAANSYILYVINPDGGTAIAVPGLTYSGVPTWTTSAGSLGAPYEANSFSVTLQATSDSNVTFSMSAGNTLPSGLTLAANGLLSGTIPATEANTTYTFYVDAIDTQNQETSRTFSVTYTRDTVTWTSPDNGAAYSLTAGTANTVSLSATSAAGKSITYSVQSGSLPANVSISGSNLTGTPNTTQSNTSVTIRATAAGTNRVADRTLYFTVSPGVVSSVDFLMVGGGGGGGVGLDNKGGGGGAGGYRANTLSVTPGTTYNVVIGTGGNGGTSATSTGGTGGTTTFAGLSVEGGGGGGGSRTSGANAPANGGGGGGGGGDGYSGGSKGTYGNYYGSNAGSGSGGNGGGGSGSGPDGSNGYNGGAGGNGTQWLDGNYYAGGGGGGGGGAGGQGGGASGSNFYNGNGNDATNWTGGGGGGGGQYSSRGGYGGHGVVILRYPDSFPVASSTTGSPTVTTSGGYRYYKFTGNGSITF